jgi:uncharacterized tellurite resistance protein B-like protein
MDKQDMARMFSYSIEEALALYESNNTNALLALVQEKAEALKDVALFAYEEAGGDKPLWFEVMLYGQIVFGAAGVITADGDMTQNEEALFFALMQKAGLLDMQPNAYIQVYANKGSEYYKQLDLLYGISAESMGKFWGMVFDAMGDAKSFMEAFVAYLDILYTIAAIDGEVAASELEAIKTVIENWGKNTRPS